MQDNEIDPAVEEILDQARTGLVDAMRKHLGLADNVPVEYVGAFDINPSTGEVKPVPLDSDPAPGRVQSPLNKALTNPKAVTIFRQIQAMVAGDPKFDGGMFVDAALPDVADVLVTAIYWAQKHSEATHADTAWYDCLTALAWVDRACHLFMTSFKAELGR